MTRTITLMATVTILLAGSAAAQSSLFRRERAAVAPAVAVRDDRPFSLIATPAPKPRTFAKEDLVTIIIREQAKNATSADIKTSRDSKIDGKADAWVYFKPSDLTIRPVQFPSGAPAIKANLKREFDGQGDTGRSDSLTARIQAKIVDVKPNGNLVIEASKMVTTDEESYTITVTGTCSTKDITPDNTVLSTQIAELEVVKKSSGPVKDATKRGLLKQLFDWFNIL